MSKIKLTDWFEIDEQEYLMYILRGYEILVIKEYDEHTGKIVWRLNGKRHREDGPAVIHKDGTQTWWLNDKLHREDGPAIIRATGTQEWWLNGKRHREDGPAILRMGKASSYWLDGTQYSHQRFNDILSASKTIPN